MDWLRLVQLHCLLVSLMCLLKGTVLSTGLENQGARCIAAERQALLDFKKDLEDPETSLPSWTSGDEDCCKWRGVGCDNTTGHVLMLNLPYDDDMPEDELLRGEIGSSLLKLRHLIHLDLSNNSFTRIPEFIGSLTELTYLNLSYNPLSGIPKSLGNLCNLKILDLSGNNLHESLTIMLKNLSGCAKNSLEILLLSENQISGSLPDVTIFSELRELFLQRNQLGGKFPVSFEQFSKLTILHLEQNQLIGPLPDLSKLSSLRELYLADNRLEGPFPNGIGQMSDLEILDVSSNSLNGVISEVHLSNLSKLKHLILSFNSLSLNLSSAWIPHFQLDSIQMASCNLGPNFPRWLRTQKKFSYLDMSNSEISEVIPSWFWSLPYNLKYLNLSFNSISGQLPDPWIYSSHFHQIDLSSNLFSGSIPQIFDRTTLLNLRGNKFSGSLSSICPLPLRMGLSYLDLSDNLLSGNLPDCLAWFGNLVILNLENNNFSGTIPTSIGNLRELRSLHLRNNNLSGTLPASLRECTKLKLLDLGENKLSGFISSWIGEDLTNLVVLRLRSNGFFGNIPSTICNLGSLQILDLSLNNVLGTIPNCLSNLTAMCQNGSSNATISFDFYIEYDIDEHSYENSREDGNDNLKIIIDVISSPESGVPHNDFASIVWKGMEQEYGNTLGLLKVIDLSSNKLSGEIPEEVTSLIGLITLNLSRNNLTGSIPGEIGRLKVLESLNLSKNHLSSGISKGLAALTYLSVLDLSNNNFSGKIPTSTQLQSFNATSYLGNPELCGDPLLKKCLPTKPPSNENEKEEDEDWFESLGFRIGMGFGFITGFWGAFGTILLSRSWRHRYFRCLSNVGDWIYFTIALKMGKLQKGLGSKRPF